MLVPDAGPFCLLFCPQLGARQVRPTRTPALPPARCPQPHPPSPGLPQPHPPAQPVAKTASGHHGWTSAARDGASIVATLTLWTTSVPTDTEFAKHRARWNAARRTPLRCRSRSWDSAWSAARPWGWSVTTGTRFPGSVTTTSSGSCAAPPGPAPPPRAQPTAPLPPPIRQPALGPPQGPALCRQGAQLPQPLSPRLAPPLPLRLAKHLPRAPPHL